MFLFERDLVVMFDRRPKRWRGPRLEPSSHLHILGLHGDLGCSIYTPTPLAFYNEVKTTYICDEIV